MDILPAEMAVRVLSYLPSQSVFNFSLSSKANFDFVENYHTLKIKHIREVVVESKDDYGVAKIRVLIRTGRTKGTVKTWEVEFCEGTNEELHKEKCMKWTQHRQIANRIVHPSRPNMPPQYVAEMNEPPTRKDEEILPPDQAMDRVREHLFRGRRHRATFYTTDRRELLRLMLDELLYKKSVHLLIMRQNDAKTMQAIADAAETSKFTTNRLELDIPSAVSVEEMNIFVGIIDPSSLELRTYEHGHVQGTSRLSSGKLRCVKNIKIHPAKAEEDWAYDIPPHWKYFQIDAKGLIVTNEMIVQFVKEWINGERELAVYLVMRHGEGAEMPKFEQLYAQFQALEGVTAFLTNGRFCYIDRGPRRVDRLLYAGLRGGFLLQSGGYERRRNMNDIADRLCPDCSRK